MIIDGSYFTGDIYLPQVGIEASSVANNIKHLQKFIDEYEPEILEKGLGSTLFDEFHSQFHDNGQLKDVAEQKWGHLLNGAEYTYNGLKYHWQGLVRTRGDRKMSMMAYYVYYRYVKDGITQKSTLGVVKPEAKNASSATAIPTLTNAWRKFHEWYGGYKGNPYYFKGNVKGVYFEDYFLGADASREVSLYQYLSYHKADFPEWSFTPIENKNSWGI